MSNARPITHVTEFVCGACWNTFSRDQLHVLQGQQLRCPHCGHLQPLRDTEEVNLQELVRDAPSAVILAPGALELGGDEPEEAEELAFRRPSALSAAVPSQAPAAPSQPPAGAGLRDLSGASSPTAPHQVLDEVEGEEDSVEISAPGAVAFEVPVVEKKAPETALPDWLSEAHVASDGELGINEEPTDPELDLLGVGAAEGDKELASESSSMLPPGELEPSSSARHEGEVSDQPPEAEERASDRPAVRESAWAETAEFDANVASLLVDSEDTQDELDSEDTQDEPEEYKEELKDWKIKSPSGLTYNFHSLDAMLGWASNKSGQEMQVSVDSENWHDFQLFIEGVRSGLSSSRALVMAAQGTSPALLQQNPPGLSAFDEIQQLDAREAIRSKIVTHESEDESSVDAASVSAAGDANDSDSLPEDAVSAEVSEVTQEEPSAEMHSTSRRTGRTPLVDLRETGGRPSGPISVSVRRVSAPQPAAEVKKRSVTPLSTPKAKSSSLSPIALAAVGVVLVVVAAGVLHFTGVVLIPGLPH